MITIKRVAIVAVVLLIILSLTVYLSNLKHEKSDEPASEILLKEPSVTKSDPTASVESASQEDVNKNTGRNTISDSKDGPIEVGENSDIDIIGESLPTLKIKEEAIKKLKKNYADCGRIYTEEAFAQKENMKTHLACQESPNWTNDCKDGIRYGNLCVKEVFYNKYRLESYGVDRAHNNVHMRMTMACNDAGMRLPTSKEIEILKRYHRNLLDKYKMFDIVGCETEFYPDESCIRNPQSHLFIDGRTKEYQMADPKIHGFQLFSAVICVKRTGTAGAYNKRKEEYPKLPPLVCPQSEKPVQKISCRTIEGRDKNLCVADSDIIPDYTYNEIFENALSLQKESGYYELIFEPLECQCRAIGMHLPTEKELKNIQSILPDAPDSVYVKSTGFSYPGGLTRNIQPGDELDNDYKIRIRCVKRLDEKE